MSDRLAVVVTVLCVTGMCPTGSALDFSDDFSRPHDYLVYGPAGTGWDGAVGLDSPAAEALDCSLERPGQLYLQSAGGYWDPARSVRSPFLYKSVTGDFVAQVRIVDFAGSADIPVPFNRAGLMVRIDPGEDWLALDYYPYWGPGNALRQADNLQLSDLGANRQSLAPDPFLQIERQGDLFFCRTSHDGQQWQELPGSPVMRPDMRGPALQVGVYQATESDQSGYAAFDAFRISGPMSGSASSSVRASDPSPAPGEDGVSQSILSWQPGRDIVRQRVYLGASPDDLTIAGDALDRDRSWLVLAAGLTAGTDYFWRVDSIDASGREHLGDLWTFSTAPYRAFNPSPASGASNLVDRHLFMTWRPGKTAIWHELYFSENRQRVENGHTSAYRGRQVNVSFDPGPLKAQTTYYWRVDEIELDAQTRRVGDVWSFSTMAQVAITDADLVGWWTFDSVSPGFVIDASGHRNHGRLLGAPQYRPGHQGMGLALDGIQDAVRCGHAQIPTGSSAFTIAAWIQPTVHNHTIVSWGLARPNQANELRLLGGHYCRHGFWDNNMDFDTGDLSGEWHHLALSWDGVQRDCYVNGSPVTGHHVGQLHGTPSVMPADVYIGANGQLSAHYFAGMIDDVRIYRRRLEAAHVMALLQHGSNVALAPQPEHRAQVAFLTRLAWTPGQGAYEHDLYLGLDQAAVTRAQVNDASGVYQGRQLHPYYVLPGDLDAGQTYYWRVDEVMQDGRLIQGRVWSFVVMASQLVDNFEQYTDYSPHRIFETWLDGLGYVDPSPGYAGNGSGSVVGYGSAPFAETTTVHSGRQSLPLAYDNRQAPYYSQADRPYAQPQDWLSPGFTGLSLAFCGQLSNRPAAEDRLYVSVEDQFGQSAQVHYEGAQSHYTDGHWHEWLISFDSLPSLDWRRMTELHFGVGNPQQPSPGSSGLLFIDDIYLTQ